MPQLRARKRWPAASAAAASLSVTGAGLQLAQRPVCVNRLGGHDEFVNLAGGPSPVQLLEQEEALTPCSEHDDAVAGNGQPLGNARQQSVKAEPRPVFDLARLALLRRPRGRCGPADAARRRCLAPSRLAAQCAASCWRQGVTHAHGPHQRAVARLAAQQRAVQVQGQGRAHSVAVSSSTYWRVTLQRSWWRCRRSPPACRRRWPGAPRRSRRHWPRSSGLPAPGAG